jgi:hypothetical protein
MCDEFREPASPLYVHVLRAAVQRLLQDGVAPLLASVKAAALPRWPTGNDRRSCPPCEGTSNIDIRDAVETEFDHVGARRGVTRDSQFGHRPAGHGLNKQRSVQGVAQK